MTSIVNLMTLLRVLVTPFIFIFLIFDKFMLCLILFVLAGITDYFDGYLARKYNAESEFGQILDPIADKILVIFLFFGLAINLSSYLIGFLGSLIVAREIWVSALRDLNSRNNNSSATKVIFIAKIKTSIQLLTISLYLFALAFNIMLLLPIADIFMIISVLVTLYTGFIYTINTFNN